MLLINRDVPVEDVGAWGASRPQIFSNLQESWSEVRNAARELATVFSVTFFIKLVIWSKRPLPNRRCLVTSLLIKWFLIYKSESIYAFYSIVCLDVTMLAQVYSQLLANLLAGSTMNFNPTFKGSILAFIYSCLVAKAVEI